VSSMSSTPPDVVLAATGEHEWIRPRMRDLDGLSDALRGQPDLVHGAGRRVEILDREAGGSCIGK
jgi:hypothetical protein